MELGFEELVFHIEKSILEEIPGGGGRIEVSMGGFGKKAVDIDLSQG